MNKAPLDPAQFLQGLPPTRFGADRLPSFRNIRGADIDDLRMERRVLIGSMRVEQDVFRYWYPQFPAEEKSLTPDLVLDSFSNDFQRRPRRTGETAGGTSLRSCGRGSRAGCRTGFSPTRSGNQEKAKAAESQC